MPRNGWTTRSGGSLHERTGHNALNEFSAPLRGMHGRGAQMGRLSSPKAYGIDGHLTYRHIVPDGQASTQASTH